VACAGDADAGQVVALEVGNHHQFGLVFFAVQEFLIVPAIEFSTVLSAFTHATRSCTLDGPSQDILPVNLQKQLRRGADDGPFIGRQISRVRAGIIRILPQEKRCRIGRKRTLEPL